MPSDSGDRRTQTLIVVLLLSQLMATMDNSIVAVATASIERDLHTSGAMIQLVMASYTMAFAALVITGARLGDEYGHSRVFAIGLIGFTVTSLACGLAPTASALVAARLFQGAFGALMVPQALSLIQLLVTGKARARAIGLYSLVLALGVAFGQILGGVLITGDLFGLGWRNVFLVNVPFGVVLTAVAIFAMPRHERLKRSRLDLRGSGLLLVTMAALVAPLSLGRDAGWPLWTWAALALGLAGCVVFVRHELSLTTHGGQPLLDLAVLRPKGVAAGLLACCTLNFAYAGILFTLTLYLQTGPEYSAMRAGLSFVPYTIGFAVTSVSWSRLPAALQRVLPTISTALYALAGVGLLLLVLAGWPPVPGSVLLLLCGAGHAGAFSPLVDQIAEAAGPRFASAISALVSAGTLFASALSVAGVGGIYMSLRTAGHSPAVAFAGGFASAVCLLAVTVAFTWRVRIAVSATAASQLSAPAAMGSSEP